MLPDKVAVPKIGVFGYSFLRTEVDLHKAKCRAVAAAHSKLSSNDQAK